MTRAFVADASIAVGWVHPDQATQTSEALLDAVENGAILTVPSLWFLEVANVLTVLVRRKKLSESHRSLALDRLGKVNTQVDHDAASIAFTRLSGLASHHNLTIYDAVYLELAIRKSLPLGSNDLQLQDAAKKCGVKVL